MVEKLINRPRYLELLKKWTIDKEMIKIITGVRRCGKSKLLELFENYLIGLGIDKNLIHNINLDILDNKDLLDPNNLYEYINKIVVPDKTNFVFIDEIQLVQEWQRVANSLRMKKNIDLYLTGSNAYMFSSKLGTLLGGRYIEIKMQPLSFKEYLEGTYGSSDNIVNSNLMDDYKRYITQSSFPQTLQYKGDMELIRSYLMDSVYGNTVNKDIIERYNLRNTVKLIEIVKYLFDNISCETNISNIEKQLKGIVSNDTINKYINGLIDSYVLYRCDRLDLKGKKILSSSPKYYICDIGLRQVLLGRLIGDEGKILENIVYLELIRRGYRVYTGRVRKQMKKGEIKQLEVDFIATKDNGLVEYYQVSTSIRDKNVLEREISSLEEINDNYPKYVLTLDQEEGMYNGIYQLNVLSWLVK